MRKIEISPTKKVFFASDFHLGVPDYHTSREREQRIISWLDSIKPQAGALFLVGDIFDFWFEYKNVVPKGYTRFFGKIAEFTDQKIPVFFFTGNHDLWMKDYFAQELGVEVFHTPQSFEILTNYSNNHISTKKIFVGHGDGVGNGDYGYKILKHGVFLNPLAKWLFAFLHPFIGMGIATGWSKHSRKKNLKKGNDDVFLGKKEWIWQYCQQIEQKTPHHFYIFGHRHLPMDLPVGTQGGRYYNLGEWFGFDTFAEFDGEKVILKEYNKPLPDLKKFRFVD